VDFGFKYPHPLSPSVDHIIPLSKGGHPSDLSNLQLAHRWCNRQKSNKLFLAGNQKNQTKNDEIDNDNLPLHYAWQSYRVKQTTP
jgi:5-methylcytosine-specific restriction endonuclease McrA